MVVSNDEVFVVSKSFHMPFILFFPK